MRLTKTLLLGVCPMALAIAPAFAQSTGSEQVETVVVTGIKLGEDVGVGSKTTASKQTSAITQDYMETQNAGQTFFESLNLLPGYNFDNNDAYGSNGGNIEMHGQGGDHISVTLDGIPLNDTGNYAMYTNQMVDPELIERVSINQGTTDVDSPTAAVTGGTIATRTARPDKDPGFRMTLSGGSDSFMRVYGKIDSGEIGPWGTRAFFAGSYTNYDKWRGWGQNDKKQFNAGIYQDMGSLGWMMLSAHWNSNRNIRYSGATMNIYSSAVVQATSAGDTSGFDWDAIYSDSVDYAENCSYTAPSYSYTTRDYTMTGCTSWHKIKHNPSDTGNIRFSSLWNLMPNLTLTLDSSLQYVLANGGGATATYETDARLIGNTSGGAPGDALDANRCIPGVGCDLNGDGDVYDRVAIATPSNTNTRRWGVNASLIYQLDETNMFRLAYTLDYGIHRQTGQAAYMNPDKGYYEPFAGWQDDKHKIVTADGYDLRGRDRSSRAILNQIAVEYVGNYLDNTLQANIGARVPFMQRDLDQRCYTQKGSYYVNCTTETPSSIDADGIVHFASTSYTYVMPAKKSVFYSKFLPHLGLSYKPFGDEHLLYANYTQELAAPRTDYLYTSTGSLYAGSNTKYYTAFENVKPETSTNYTIGYRYLGEDLNGSIALWNNQVKNRIVSSYDEATGLYQERNVPGINYAGVDVDVSYKIFENLLVYGAASYTSARNTFNIYTSATGFIATAGKQMSNVPKWTFKGRVQYKPLPELRVGMDFKYRGSRYASDDNYLKVPDNFVLNADIAYEFTQFGLEGSSLSFNVNNLFDRKYISAISTTINGAGGSSAYLTPGTPRSFMISLTAKY